MMAVLLRVQLLGMWINSITPLNQCSIVTRDLTHCPTLSARARQIPYILNGHRAEPSPQSDCSSSRPKMSVGSPRSTSDSLNVLSATWNSTKYRVQLRRSLLSRGTTGSWREPPAAKQSRSGCTQAQNCATAHAAPRCSTSEPGEPPRSTSCRAAGRCRVPGSGPQRKVIELAAGGALGRARSGGGPVGVAQAQGAVPGDGEHVGVVDR